MRSENGIPRPFQPSNLAQGLRDLRRDVAELKARRNFVSVERIVEGGTINENVGKQLTETVQKDIVIDGGNLGEGALDGQRMVGAIIETNATANRGVKIDDTGLRGYDADGNRYIKADETGLQLTGELEVQGRTLEATPKTMLTRLGNIQRTYSGETVSAPGLSFTTNSQVLESAPGIYSPDGRKLRLQGENFLDMYQVDISPDGVSVVNPSITLGRFNIASQVTQSVAITGSTVDIGYKAVTPYGDRDAAVNLLGSVKVNGTPVMRTVIAGLPAGAQPVELIGTGSARTSAAGVFTITFPPGTFGTACMSIDANPTSGTAGIPVVNGGRLFAGSAEMVIPSAPNTTITYSYRAVGY